MIISKLKGGLGNQMFQYAVGLFMAVKYEEELKLDSIGYDDPRYIMANTPRVYRLFPFNLKSTLASKEEIDKYRNMCEIWGVEPALAGRLNIID